MTADRFREAERRLAAAYGERQWHPREGEVLDGLVRTILSQNTSDANSGRAFQALKAAFPTWDEVRTADLQSLAQSIRCGGLAATKAARLQALLQAIYAERGETCLEHLREWSDEDIRAYLGRFPGIGPKTIACLLLFTLGRADFPVDTHVWRLARRLGWVPESSSREATYETLNALVPNEIKYALHVLLIHHGRVCCRPQRPRCARCCLADRCAFYTTSRSLGGKGRDALNR
jgi:endonuclease-3